MGGQARRIVTGRMMDKLASEPGTAAALDDPNTELASDRTAMSFDRTVMSSDQTLMSVVRTSLSLIGFGFTIFQFFYALKEKFPEAHLSAEAPRRFGGSLILLGLILLTMGLWYHRRQIRALRSRCQALHAQGLIRSPQLHKESAAAGSAMMLLIIGSLALLGVALRAGPF